MIRYPDNQFAAGEADGDGEGLDVGTVDGWGGPRGEISSKSTLSEVTVQGSPVQPVTLIAGRAAGGTSEARGLKIWVFWAK